MKKQIKMTLPKYFKKRDPFFEDMINRKSGRHLDKKKANNKKLCRKRVDY